MGEQAMRGAPASPVCDDPPCFHLTLWLE